MPKYTLYADVRLTRKRTLHHILNEHDAPAWSGRTIAQAFAWLLEAGETEFTLEGQLPDERFLVMIHRE